MDDSVDVEVDEEARLAKVIKMVSKGVGISTKQNNTGENNEATVLEGVESEVVETGGFWVVVDSDDAALFAGLIVVGE
ncbi:hypothetical protein L6452_35969 [Arctium lappa]|uniref:Uncharacterized protein n=1 Tax=Arctium lappa TaxID=4217 RepID=A0ACB8Y836_ARCLA|nr:hypothetical protein L6452_35969 [Arctium lappa]